MDSSRQQTHRPGPLHQTNKAHKGGRHMRKSSVVSEVKNKSVVRPIAKVKREERLNQAQQTRRLKREKAIEKKRRLGNEIQAPLLVGVLDTYLNNSASFLRNLAQIADDIGLTVKAINDRSEYVLCQRLKTRFKFVAINSNDLDETLDIVKSLDLMIILHNPGASEEDEDYLATDLMRTIRIHCLPTLVHVIDGTDAQKDGFSAKIMMNAKRILRSRLKEDKVHSIEKNEDYLQLLNIIGSCKRQESLFKDNRALINPDKVEIVDNALVFEGFVRNKVLSPNDLVHIVGYDDYQIKQIDIVSDIAPLKQGSVPIGQTIQSLKPDPMKQETLDQENDIDPMDSEQTWPTADELAAEAERRNTKRIIKKLPPGTSEYQGAWIPEDSDEDDESISSDERNNDIVMSDAAKTDSESGDDDDAISSICEEDVAEMEVDDYDKSISQDKERKIMIKLKEARIDEMFPDEVDTPADIDARVRFARYRGLKSFRTSSWDPQENLPPDYSRIFQFQNFQQTKRRILNEELENSGDKREWADPGQYVRIHLLNVPHEIIASVLSRSTPPILVGLLKYERKMTVMNFLIKKILDINSNEPIKSKDELIFYAGFRKFKARPLFTAHSISSKFKYERFLRDDVAMVATMYAPITFPPAPVLVFRQKNNGDMELVASGSVLDSNPNRLIIKRIRLSGHPYKIHSKAAVLRFMFFNSADIMYFKPVELVTRYNRRGHISEPLGTHGHMKCMFDRKIRSDDCVFMNLYKRVFPKWNYKPLIQLK